MKRFVAATLALSVSLASAAPAPAQLPDSLQGRPTEPLFVKEDLYLLAGFAALTVAMWPIDESAALRLQRDPVQNRRLYANTATFFRVLGAPVSLATGVGMYAAGAATRKRWLADAGLHVTEGMILASVITQTGKALSGRARPRHFRDTLGIKPFEPNPRDFQFGRGWGKGEFQSFPSGHTSAAFAFASALVSEIHRHRPSWTWFTGPIFYGGATMVGISRMYNNAHWASDVAAGAAVGTFAGIKAVRYNHSYPNNRVNRLLLDPMVGTDGQNHRITWSFEFR